MKVVAAACVVLLSVLWPAGTSARSIFDDDWVPPKAAERPRPATPSPTPPPVVPPPTPVKPPADPTSGDSAKTPKSPDVAPAPSGIIAPPARRPVPDKALQAASRRALKEVFADQLADRSPAARRKLTGSLLGYADKSEGAPADQFVLLAAAVDAAVDAADLTLAFRAAERMAGGYEVDGLGVKADAALRLPKPVPPALAPDNVRAVMELTAELAAAADYATATRVCVAMQALVAADPALRGQVQQRQRQLVAAREAADRVAADVAKLKAAPDDPAANASVGRYLCLVKNDWDAGLPMLAKGAEARLKELARRDQRKPEDAKARYALAGEWWELAADRQHAQFAVALHHRAAYWYGLASPELEGLAKTLALKRVADAAEEQRLAGTPASPADRNATVYRTVSGGDGVELGAAERKIGRQFLIQFDVKADAARNKCLLTKRRKEGDSSLSILTSSHGAVVVADDRSFYRRDIKGTTPIADGKWHTVRIEKEGNDLRLFVDGKPDGEGTLEHEFSSPSPWLLGRHGTWGPEWTLDAEFRNVRLEGEK